MIKENLFHTRWFFFVLLFFTVAVSFSARTQDNRGVTDKAEQAKKEILAAEKSFADLCKREGMEKAFTSYADDNARILLNDKVLTGIADIAKHYSDPKYKKASLDWSPDFVDASACGDMGYTYGHYTFTVADTTGKKKDYKGIFHTVWTKRAGVWKFVWDN